jgi:hypothetical protein
MSKSRSALASAAVVLCSLLALAPVASATTATATLTGGSLAFINGTPAAVSFSGALNGANQTLTTTQPYDVSDATGSAAGWNVTATSTQFLSGAKTLAIGATTVPSAPSIACDATVTCTVATNTTTYPYTLPAATTAPTATKMIDASAATGMGNQTVTPTWSLAIPAATQAGIYTSTWTMSLVSGP